MEPTPSDDTIGASCMNTLDSCHALRTMLLLSCPSRVHSDSVSISAGFGQTSSQPSLFQTSFLRSSVGEAPGSKARIVYAKGMKRKARNKCRETKEK
ncbi:hypothetical protein CR513_53141, partial [Mucuna pruriens]